ncbi:MAG: AIR carboxylase family protein [Candidatus Bathyarchaeaceae archaeon]
MPKGKIIVLMGSKRDYEFASRIGNFLKEEGFPVECHYNVASAHKAPKKLLDDLKEYEKSGDNIVLITVAGLSDALSGVVAGYTKYPVIACPPDSEKYGGAKIFSSVATPKGIAVAYIPEPENAAFAAVKILALSNHSLYEKIRQYRRRMEENVYESAEEMKMKG